MDQPELLGVHDFPADETALKAKLVELAALEADNPIATATTPEKKWRVVSALQKAIRRGLVDQSMRYAHALLTIDRAYLRQRLVVIALEDVGLANVLGTALTLLWAGDKFMRAGPLERNGLLACVRSMASGIKDRTLTDAYILSTVGKAQAGWGIPIHGYDAHVSSHPYLPWAVRYIATRGRTMCRYPMACWAVSQWEDMVSTAASLREAPIGPPVLVGKVISSAYDQHNREGKQAIAYFAKACAPVREFLTARLDLNPLRVLGLAVFLEDGAVLDKMLCSPSLDSIRLGARNVDFYKYGLMPDTGEQLCVLVRDNLAALDQARSRVVAPHQPPAGTQQLLGL